MKLRLLYVHMYFSTDFTEFELFLNWSIWPIERTLTGTAILSQNEPRSNDN